MLNLQRLFHGLPLDVIVIDFFHWTRQGDWHFDPEYWPDPKAMCDELHAMLRFISAVKIAFATVQTFQYIPCYGLSSAPCCHRIGATSFQYIPCYGLSPGIPDLPRDRVRISIHPMLRFIKKTIPTAMGTAFISIHPMLRFIRNHQPDQLGMGLISIHPMLRFILCNLIVYRSW